ncbi:MAG: M1 family aminopeptidase [Planctomycetota bacterium]|nr:M1 family aminopeptidase [Planctomycetota bacterium]MDA1106323.1 M1 family aminopeptidase [Planctomycetota bacterium]
MKHNTQCAFPLVVFACLVAAAAVDDPPTPTPPADRPAIADPATGRDIRTWPPNRLVDYLHMKLAVDMDDLASESFEGRQELTVRALGLPVDSLTLDAVNLKNLSVATQGGQSIPFDYDGRKLTVKFPAPLPPGGEMTLVTTYRVEHPEMGMVFSPPGEGTAAQFHTQGQAEENSYWFPCHDSPNERLTTELLVSVPRGVLVSGNGRLAAHTVDGDRETWHWVQSKPHVIYLVSLVGGEFERTALPAGPGGVPMTVWARPGQGDDVRETFARTGAMMGVFEQAFGVPYPWDRYDQLCARGFGSGGMENTSATTLLEGAVLDERSRAERDMDGLISHELCHQWTGDYITCHDWRDIWLNEGWATYGEALWFEARDGDDGYFDELYDNAGVASADRVATNNEAMCINLNGPASFERAANPYPKGASILHMLREMLGDQVFFDGVHLYMDRHGLGTTETSDFRRALEQVSGLELAWFFDQWCQRPGCPEIAATATWAAGEGIGGTLTMALRQTQPIDPFTPAFRFMLPIRVTISTGEVVERTVNMRENSSTIDIALASTPTMVEIDPRLTVLKQLSLTMPQEWLVEQGVRGSTLASQRMAIRAISSELGESTAAALVVIALDSVRRDSVRVEAIECLGRGTTDAAKVGVAHVFAARPDRGRVRAAAVEAYGADHGVEALPELVVLLQSDQGIAARVAACEAIERWKPSMEGQDELRAALVALCKERTSQGSLECAAMEACASLGISEALPFVEVRTARGEPDRERGRAVQALGRLAPTEGPDRAHVVGVLVECLNDPEDACFQSAGQALDRLNAPEAIEVLDAIASESPKQGRRAMAKRWSDRISKANAPAEAAPVEGTAAGR